MNFNLVTSIRKLFPNIIYRIRTYLWVPLFRLYIKCEDSLQEATILLSRKLAVQGTYVLATGCPGEMHAGNWLSRFSACWESTVQVR